MRQRIARYTVLNVAANPHPEGIYHQVFKEASKQEGLAYGRNWFAKLSPPSKADGGFFHGRIGVWHELKGKAIQTRSLERQDLSTLLNPEADGFGFPSKVFSFSFRERDHLMFVEIKNDEGDVISPASLGSAVQTVLSRAAKTLEIDLGVTVLPQSDTVDEIFKLNMVRKILLDFTLPNAGDDLSKEKQAIIDRLKRRGINRQKAEYTKAKSAERIEFDGELKAEIEIGAENGKVVASGKDDQGVRKVIDTTRRPTTIDKPVSAEDSSVGTLRQLAQEY